MAFTVGGIAIAGAGANIIGGVMGAGAAKTAAGQQADALRQALAFQQSVYGTTQQNLAPFISGGTNALAAVSQLYGLPAPSGTALPAGNALDAYKSYTQTPFYTFPLSQGTDALNRSGAARGLSLSGGQANALQQYGQNYASSNFSTYINALSSLANLGQSSAAQLGQQGNSAAGNVTGIQTGIGNAVAAGTIGSQNQINNALGSIPLLLSGVGGGGLNSGSSYGDLVSGFGNILSGYNWNGTPGSGLLSGLSAQANGNVSGGAGGL